MTETRRNKKGKDKDRPWTDDKSAMAKDKVKAVWVMSTPQNRASRKRGKENYEFIKDMYSILLDIEDKEKVEGPAPMRTPVHLRNHNKYCHFHK